MSTEDKPRVVVTGAAGRLGSLAVDHLKRTGKCDVVATDAVSMPGVVAADLTTAGERWEHLLSGAQAILHCAGHRGPGTTWDEAVRLNMDMSMRLMLRARRNNVRRLVFLSSNWVMAGHRFGTDRLSTELTPEPINPYGMSKLAIERAGLSHAELGDFEFIALRIGMVVTDPGQLEDRLTNTRRWTQQMWLSQADYCQGVERALFAPLERSAIVNLMSNNPGMRWDIDATREAIGYAPLDGHAPDVRPALDQVEADFARLNLRRREIVDLLTAGSSAQLPAALAGGGR